MLRTIIRLDGRSVQDSTYRYGFNGKESDDEIKDFKGSYDFGARLYDTRVGKWLSVDPKANLRSWMSPFNFVQNNPIMRIDPDGRLDGEYTIDKNTGETNKISDLGDNEGIDFYSVGESRDKGTAFVADQTFTIERNADGGNINMFRIQEDSKGTISSFHIPQNETTGFFLEPGGPSTTQANQDKRIPEGQFNLILSKDRPGVNADNLRFPNNFVLYNQDVSMGRGITFHSGNFNDQTEGCPMPGCGFGIGQVGQAGIKTPIQIQDRSDFLRTTQSIPKLKVINSFINTQGAENVKINIHNAITQ